MNLEVTIQGIWNEAKQGGRTAFLRAGLRLLSLPYRGGVAARTVSMTSGSCRR